jgi:hypothetical protein
MFRWFASSAFLLTTPGTPILIGGFVALSGEVINL